MSSESERSLTQDQFVDLTKSIHRELVIANRCLTNLEALVKAGDDPAMRPILNRYGGFFVPAIWAFLDGVIIAMQNCISKHPRAASLIRAMESLKTDADLSKDVDIEELSTRLTELVEKLNKIEQWRHNWSAHRDLDATLPKVKIGEVRPLLDKLSILASDICTKPSRSALVFELPDGDHVKALLQHISDYEGK